VGAPIAWESVSTQFHPGAGVPRARRSRALPEDGRRRARRGAEHRGVRDSPRLPLSLSAPAMGLLPSSRATPGTVLLPTSLGLLPPTLSDNGLGPVGPSGLVGPWGSQSGASLPSDSLGAYEEGHCRVWGSPGYTRGEARVCWNQWVGDGGGARAAPTGLRHGCRRRARVRGGGAEGAGGGREGPGGAGEPA